MFKGRIFGDSWGGRKDPAALIDNPVDLIEHILRLSNWNDAAVSPGLEYSSNAKINTASFDSTALDPVRNMKISYQIFDSQLSDDLIKEICAQFWLINYQDENGLECLKIMIKDGQSISKIIKYDDFVTECEPIEEPEEVFNCGKFYYNYDYATGTYLSSFSIAGVDKDTWDSSYTSGFASDADAAEVWGICKSNYQKYQRKFNPVNDSINKLKWVYRYEDALELMKWRFEWSRLKKTGFTISYLDGKSLSIGEKIKLESKHLSGLQMASLIYDLDKNKKDNTASVKVGLLDYDNVLEVQFNTDGGTAIETQYVWSGDKVLTPPIPVKDGVSFGGFWKEATFEHIWNFAYDTVLDNTILYAKWVDTGSGGYIMDGNGNIYRTIVIGNQEWIIQNLRATKYMDGTDIPHVTDGAIWSSLSAPAYCWYNNTTDLSFRDKYGALYNWYVGATTNPKQLAPEGWRVPTMGDWEQLRDYLIANRFNYDGTTEDDKTGKALASDGGEWSQSGTVGHIGNDQQSNNSTGFSNLPGGARWGNGSFTASSSIILGDRSNFWDSTRGSGGGENAHRPNCGYNDAIGIRISSGDLRWGCSIRLVRDV